MLKSVKQSCRKWFFRGRAFVVAKLSKSLMWVLMKTCRIQVTGVEHFVHLAQTDKCLLMLWHNRLAPVCFILSHYTKDLLFAALISASRDGNILSTLVHSYKRGRTIRVSHQARYQALQELIRHVQERQHIVVVTPDGPRGPRYEMKPGVALAALETQAAVVTLNWEAKRYWEFNTWDRLRLPKPFTTIHVTFGPVVRLGSNVSLEEAKVILKQALPS
jgi:lysophospholipid acyltransferase (LPLAT)-like uncharacterized protein